MQYRSLGKHDFEIQTMPLKHQGYFFDMDGILFNSMPWHAEAWERVMAKHQLDFTARDCYLNEGRTGYDVIHEAITKRSKDRVVSKEEIDAIYAEKCAAFQAYGKAKPVDNVDLVLQYLHRFGVQIWIVTGSGQQSLFDELDNYFPHIFRRDHMVTAFDVTKGKPDPEPYLKAWEGSGLPKEACCVIENAPLGILAAKRAGLYTIGINTGILSKEDLKNAGADIVFDTMDNLLDYLQQP